MRLKGGPRQVAGVARSEIVGPPEKITTNFGRERAGRKNPTPRSPGRVLYPETGKCDEKTK